MQCLRGSTVEDLAGSMAGSQGLSEGDSYQEMADRRAHEDDRQRCSARNAKSAGEARATGSPTKLADVAQLVEQGFCNLRSRVRVPPSAPKLFRGFRASIVGDARVVKGADCKSAAEWLRWFEPSSPPMFVRFERGLSRLRVVCPRSAGSTPVKRRLRSESSWLHSIWIFDGSFVPIANPDERGLKTGGD